MQHFQSFEGKKNFNLKDPASKSEPNKVSDLGRRKFEQNFNSCPFGWLERRFCINFTQNYVRISIFIKHIMLMYSIMNCHHFEIREYLIRIKP